MRVRVESNVDHYGEAYVDLTFTEDGEELSVTLTPETAGDLSAQIADQVIFLGAMKRGFVQC